MSPSSIALVVICAIVALASALGFYAGTHRKMSLEQWTVGGRGFGPLLMWLLMAGEVYTAFSFLGASGWAYSRGAPIYYVLAYLSLGNVLAFFIIPAVWELGLKHGLQTQPDFFLLRYGSKYLAGFVAAVGVVFIIPYLQLQLTGLGIIVEIASFDRIGRTEAMVIAVAILAGFVLISGIRAVAWVSIPKDFLMLLAALTIGIWVPHHYFGGIGPMFTVLMRAKPTHLTMPGATHNLSHSWYISAVLLSAVGGYMWPTTFGATFTAKSADTLRRNTVILPLYTISLGFMFLTGFTALLVIPGLANGDLCLLTIVRKTFPAWMLGVIGGAGALTAMVPAAVLILTASTLFAKNLARPIFAPTMTDDGVAKLARLTVVALSLIALYISIHSSATLVSMLLLGYAGVAQFSPGVVLGLFWKRLKLAGVFAGLVVGVTCTTFLDLSGRDALDSPFGNLSAGFVALCLNYGVTVVVSLLASIDFDEAK
jgi:SSS family solute:Na+ symporter